MTDHAAHGLEDVVGPDVVAVRGVAGELCGSYAWDVGHG
jgi:hypothetical protein